MDAKEILKNRDSLYRVQNMEFYPAESCIKAMEEYATLRTQSLQDKVKELESALTESKLREERLRETLKECNEAIKWSQDNTWVIDQAHQSDFFNILMNAFTNSESLLSSNQADKDRETEFTHCPNCTTKPQCATQKQCNLINH